MNSILYIIMIAAALAMGIYAVLVQRGANIVRFGGEMTAVVLIEGGLQLAASLIGYFLGSRLLTGELAKERNPFWIRVVAGVLFGSIGIRMLIAAFRKRGIEEHRMEHIDLKTDVALTLRVSLSALLAGIACGILEFNLLHMILAVLLAVVLSVIGGYVSGRAYGADNSGQACAIGGGLLCLVGIFLQVLK